MFSLIKKSWQWSTVPVWMTVAVSLLIGGIVPTYVGLMNGQFGKLALLPVLLVLALLLVWDRKLMLMLIIVGRAAGDVLFESMRFSLGSMEIGVGGLINAFVIFIAILLLLDETQKGATKPLPRMLWMWVPFLVMAMIGVVYAPMKGDAIRSWLALFSCFMMFLSAFYFVRKQEDFLFCVKLVLASSILPVLYAFVDIALNAGHGGPDGFRVQSTFSHPNVFAFYLTLMISLVFYLLKRGDAPPRIDSKQSFLVGVGLTAYLFLLLGLLVLTKTRSAWAGCLTCFLLYAVFFERRYLLYLVGLGVVAMFIPGVAERLADLGHGNEVINYSKLNSFAWRVQLWESALHWTSPSHYLMGQGFQSFKEYSPVFFSLAGGIHWQAHSVFVQILFELGLLGLAAFLYLFYRAIRELWTMLQFDRLGAFLLIVVLLNYLIYAFSDNMLEYLSLNWYLWFIVGAGCALVALRSRTVINATNAKTSFYGAV